MVHFLKIYPQFFNDIVFGVRIFDERTKKYFYRHKNFEVRKKDRNYKEGDYIAFNEFDPDRGYTGRSFVVQICYILNDDRYCKDGYVILVFKLCLVNPFSCVLSEDNFFKETEGKL